LSPGTSQTGGCRISTLKASRCAALLALLRPLNLTYVVEPGAVWISSAKMIQGDAAKPQAEPRTTEGQVLQVLQSPVLIEFEDIHVSEILQFMADSWDVNIVLDWRVVRSKGRPKNDTALGSPGYVTDAIVAHINLKDISFAEALHLLLRPLNLTYTSDRGFPWVSSPEFVHVDAVTSAS